MRAGLGRVAVLQAVVVMVLDGVLVLVPWEGPEAVEVDSIAEASRQGVHKQASGWAFYVYFVGQPVPRRW